MEFISVGYESTKYLINRFILQECRNVVECVWLWRISVGYSQEMSMLRIGAPKSQFSCRLILMIMKCKYIHL